MSTWALAAGVVLVAAFLQASTGFGFSLVSVPFLITIFAPSDAILMTLILSLALSLTMLRSMRAETDATLLKRWVWSGLAGVPAGMLLFLVLPVLWIKLILALSLAVAMIFLTARLRLRRTAWGDIFSGFLSGLLTASVGLPGPPLLVYTASANLKKSVVRSTTLTFYTIVYAFGIVSHIGAQGVTVSALATTALLLIPLLLGIGLGRVAFPIISQRLFAWLLYGILICTELYLIASLWGIPHLP